MPRVAIVTNSLSGGGAERSMNIVANKLYELGIDISIIAINQSGKDLINNLCPVHLINRKWRSGLIATISAFYNFQILIRKVNPDYIVLNCDLPELFGALSLTRASIVGVEHVGTPYKNRIFLGHLIRFILRLRRCRWVAVSNHLLIWPRATIPMTTIPNPIYIVSRPCLDRPFDFKEFNRVVFIGRLTHQKRPDLAVEVSASVNLPLIIFGEGEKEQHIKSLVNTLGVETEFIGFIPNPWEYIRGGDILVIPSFYEGDGLVVIEALSHRIPFLLSDIPDFRRFKLPEFLYCTDAASFGAKIASFEPNSLEFKVSESVRSRILKDRDISDISEKWLVLLKDLAK